MLILYLSIYPNRLALDCVGGQPAINMANALRPSSTLIIYGAMSRKPTTIPTSLFIFRDLRVRGFRFNKWVEDHPEGFLPMIETLSTLLKAGKLKIAMKFYELGTDFEAALRVRIISL